MKSSIDNILKYEATSPPAVDKLWSTWNSGQFEPYVPLLMNFLEQQRETITSASQQSQQPQEIILSLKQLIVEKGAVDHRSENNAQTEEIRREVWYCGEKGDYDELRIGIEWAERHAAAWRNWRIAEYLFVLDRIAERVLNHFFPRICPARA